MQQEGQWQRCVELYWNALEIDGLDESINRELISAYLSQGRHADAQGVYRQYARLLDSELGVRPSSELRQLVYPE